jgi:phage head maturation protease
MSTPPRENLFRASFPSGVKLREDADTAGGMPTMTGHFTVFNQWAEIKSRWEGHFLERFAPGSLERTFKNNGDKIRVMFQHGKDPQIGEKLLGVPSVVREDGDVGGYYEVPLFDTTYNRDLLPGLKANAYGASMRFTSLHEDYKDAPGVSAYNPDGIPERTIREARIGEAGPVVWPAYAGATAGVRSITDLIHDIDAVTAATPILLDEERLGHATAWIRQSLAPEERKDYSTDERKQLAKEGKALPDGSFPIVTVADLSNAIGLAGNASDPAAAKAHIKKRAAALGQSDMIPDSWSGGMASATPDVESVDRDATIEAEQDAPLDDEPEAAKATPRPWSPRKTPATKWWLPGDQREVPKSWQ